MCGSLFCIHGIKWRRRGERSKLEGTQSTGQRRVFDIMAFSQINGGPNKKIVIFIRLIAKGLY